MNKIIIALLCFSLLFFTACSDNSETSEQDISDTDITQAKKELLDTETTTPEIIVLDAKRWEYTQKEIRIKKWSNVILRVNNSDTFHGIAIPEMQLVWDEEIQVDTSVTWEFEFRCANYCGDGHEDMVGKIIIE